jgi:hypothetical protein
MNVHVGKTWISTDATESFLFGKRRYCRWLNSVYLYVCGPAPKVHRIVNAADTLVVCACPKPTGHMHRSVKVPPHPVKMLNERVMQKNNGRAVMALKLTNRKMFTNRIIFSYVRYKVRAYA